ncbi:hypothetical protein B7486_50575 [cyanobacterium TDX16]|nr:hypothetical protein B7486_50575 [cyanobacterium TDX16]
MCLLVTFVSVTVQVVDFRGKSMRADLMIRWRLHQIMAEQRKRNKDLAQAIEMSESRVSRLRKHDTMPAMKPETLNAICKFLRCQPGDLLIYEDDPEERENIGANPDPTILVAESKSPIEPNQTQNQTRNHCLLAIVEVLESA